MRINGGAAKHSKELRTYFKKLFNYYGPQHWWPGDTPFEIAVGAILTQNTAWHNVEKAIHKLKQADAIEPETLHRLPIHRLAELIRPSGYYNLKARRLKAFTEFLFHEYDGDLNRMFREKQEVLRPKLLGITGVGPETADSILLYAGGFRSFVVDTYTKRVFIRHDLIDEDVSYHDLRSWFMRGLPKDPKLYNEFHALVVRVGKDYCGSQPRCERCPLEPFLDERASQNLLKIYR